MIVVDTGAMIALLDRSDKWHAAIKDVYQHNTESWILPVAVLAEIDYLVSTRFGSKAQEAFLDDLSDGLFSVEWGCDEDLRVARGICSRYRSLRIGLVDAMVIATAERLSADCIATVDLRHFAAISIKGNPRLLPRDL